MNEIPLLNLVPQPWRDYIVLGAVLLPILGRAYHALATGGGLVGAWRALMFGTNTPKD